MLDREVMRAVTKERIARFIVVFIVGTTVCAASMASASFSTPPPYESADHSTTKVEDPTGNGAATATASADRNTGQIEVEVATAGNLDTGFFIPPFPAGQQHPGPTLFGIGATKARGAGEFKQSFVVSAAGTYSATVQVDSVVTQTSVSIKPGPSGVYLSAAFATFQAQAFLSCFTATGSSYSFLRGDPYAGTAFTIQGSVTCDGPGYILVEPLIEAFTEAEGQARSSAHIQARVASVSIF